MTLIKTSLLSSIATIIKILTGFITVKIISVYLGPSGLALVAQVNNFIGLLTSLSSGGIGNGIVKYTAEFKENKVEIFKTWSTALKLSVVLSLIIGIFVSIFSKKISFYLLGNEEFYFVFLIFSLLVIFFTMNTVFTSIFNGLGEIKKLTFLNVVSSLIGLFIALLLILNFGLKGALISGIVSQFIIFFVIVIFLKKSSLFSLRIFKEKFDIKTLYNLLNFSGMTLTAVIMNMGALIFLRNYIGNNFGWDSAGYWQGIWRISETYLMLITMTLSIYYLPKLSEIQNKKELIKEILYGYKIIIPVVILMAGFIYIFRDFLIRLIFSDDFQPMSDLFLFQLIGDVVKIASWLLGYIMIAKAMTGKYILLEIISVLNFVVLSIIFLNIYGLVGITLAFMVNYIFYFAILALIFKRYFS